MLKIARIVLNSDIVYDNVDVYKFGEPGGKFIPDLFERFQLYICNATTRATVNMNMIAIMQLRRMPIQPYMTRVKRLVVTYGETSFGPAYLIPESYYNELDIPALFEYNYKQIDHCAFIADGWLYLTRDDLIISIEH